MPSIVITLTDTSTGGVAVHSDFVPAVGRPCSPAQSAALEIVNRTTKEWGIAKPAAVVNFVQTTGHVHALKDETGNRRFWPQEVK